MRNRILMIFIALFLTGCASAPHIQTEVDIPPQNIDAMPEYENLVKLVFYNGSSKILYMDKNSKIQLTINGKGVGEIGPNQYALLHLKKGEYTIDLLHWDLWNFRSTHKIYPRNSLNIYELKATPVSNKCTRVYHLPKKFWLKFTPALSGEVKYDKGNNAY